MKRYKVKYFLGGRSRPAYIFELSKTRRRNGWSVYFFKFGLKDLQNKSKNDLLNGIEKECNIIGENWHFTNWKKGKRQGIDIFFDI